MRVSLHPKQALSGMLVACLCLLTAVPPHSTPENRQSVQR